MGTRNLTVVILDKEVKIAQYGQWDGGFTGQGEIVVDFLCNKLDRPKFLKKLRELSWLNTNDQKKINQEFKLDGTEKSISYNLADQIDKLTLNKNL